MPRRISENPSLNILRDPIFETVSCFLPKIPFTSKARDLKTSNYAFRTVYPKNKAGVKFYPSTLTISEQ